MANFKLDRYQQFTFDPKTTATYVINSSTI